MNEKMNKLQTQPYRGARDFYPEEMRIQNYIFDTWKKVCRRYGFEQYDFPILEPFEIFAAKSGEELVNEQLFSFEDRSGRKLAIRPELTPGTVRLLAQKYKEIARPVKWFMIGNNWRYEKPQMGRGREFNQLEVNIFGIEDITADFEIFSIIVDIMNEFGATEGMYGIKVSDRRLITSLLRDVLELDEAGQVKIRRIMDKRSKMSIEDFKKELQTAGLSPEQSEKVELFMTADLDSLKNIIPSELLSKNGGYTGIKRLFELLEQNDISKFVEFDPSIIRGFDYSDKLVYEVFDKNPENRRSIFGGERFDDLIKIFGEYELPATGFAMGDYTLLEFLKGWNLLPKPENALDYFITLWPEDSEKFRPYTLEITREIRKTGKSCFVWTEAGSKLDKQLKYADKKSVTAVLIIGDEELKNRSITIKTMDTGVQEIKPLEKFLDDIK